MRHHSPSRLGDRQRGGSYLGHTASVESWSFWQGASTPKADRVLERCSHKQGRETALQRGSSFPRSKPAAAQTTEDQGKDKTTQRREVSTLSYWKLGSATLIKRCIQPTLILCGVQKGDRNRHRVVVKDTCSKVQLFAWLSALPLTGCVRVGRPPDRSVPSFPHLQNEPNSPCFLGFTEWLTHEKALKRL